MEDASESLTCVLPKAAFICMLWPSLSLPGSLGHIAENSNFIHCKLLGKKSFFFNLGIKKGKCFPLLHLISWEMSNWAFLFPSSLERGGHSVKVKYLTTLQTVYSVPEDLSQGRGVNGTWTVLFWDCSLSLPVLLVGVYFHTL